MRVAWLLSSPWLGGCHLNVGMEVFAVLEPLQLFAIEDDED